MSVAGPQNPGTMTNNTSGDIGWTNPSNVQYSDDIYSTISLSGISNLSHDLLTTNYGFSIPSGATINGIIVEVEKKNVPDGLGGQTDDTSAKMIKGGTITGNNKAIAGNWSTTESFVSYGASNDLWGTSWTYTDINASNFGFAFQVTGSGTLGRGNPHVDNIRITVYYTASGGANQGIMF